jgi:hypothetical protein
MKKLVFVLFLISILIVGCKGETGNTATTPGGKEVSGSGISDILSNRASTYKVSYDTSTSGQTEKVTMAFKQNKVRYDTVANVQGQETTTSVFMLDGKTYVCTEKPQKMCLATGETDAPSTGAEAIEDDMEKYTITALPSRTIAGTAAKCFKFVSSDASADMCYSNDGVMLYVKSDQMEMTATSYTTSVPDSTFELPSTPQDINEMMKQYQS